MIGTTLSHMMIVTGAVRRILTAVRASIRRRIWIAEYELAELREVHTVSSRHWWAAGCSAVLGLLAQCHRGWSESAK